MDALLAIFFCENWKNDFKKNRKRIDVHLSAQTEILYALWLTNKA